MGFTALLVLAAAAFWAAGLTGDFLATGLGAVAFLGAAFCGAAFLMVGGGAGVATGATVDAGAARWMRRSWRSSSAILR